MRILVVDDQADMRLLLRRWLERPDCEVDEASSGEDALARRGEGHDVVVLDHLMAPGMSGLDAARALRKVGDARPIVVCSAYITPALHEEAAAMEVEMAEKEDYARLAERVRELAP